MEKYQDRLDIFSSVLQEHLVFGDSFEQREGMGDRDGEKAEREERQKGTRED